jgi:hypothetical protein
MIDAPETPRTATLNASPRTLALIVGGGLLAGTLIVVGAILPAEYNVDPLGLGKLTGVSRLWAPEAQSLEGAGAPMSWSSETPPAVHVADIPLGAKDWDEAALEYKVYMLAGQGVLYRWEARTLDGAPLDAPIEFDMHGHDVVAEGEAETVVDYRKGRALADQGSFTAPLEGIHGWYFRNHSEEPAMIRLEVEGYFRVIPPGEPGNEFGVRPLESPAADPAP